MPAIHTAVRKCLFPNVTFSSHSWYAHSEELTFPHTKITQVSVTCFSSYVPARHASVITLPVTSQTKETNVLFCGAIVWHRKWPNTGKINNNFLLMQFFIQYLLVQLKLSIEIRCKRLQLRSQSKKKPNIWNSASVSRRRMLATVVPCSGDFKLYFHTSHITPLQLVIELGGLEWTCV